MTQKRQAPHNVGTFRKRDILARIKMTKYAKKFTPNGDEVYCQKSFL
jgi:hypothetical protein